MAIPKKVAERLVSGMKRYVPILESAKTRDVGETDTVTIIKDMLADVFGYDKYAELTSEYAIRGTYCDLAIKLDGKLTTLIEVKAVGIELKDQHVKQAVDYAANQGVDWVLLTTGIRWCVYRVQFTKPIQHDLVLDMDLMKVDYRSESDLEKLYLWCKEGWQRSALGEFQAQQQALSKFYLGAVVLSEPCLDTIRRELRRISPDIKITTDQIKTSLTIEVLKREVVEGEKAVQAAKVVAKAAKTSLRSSPSKDDAAEPKSA